MTLWATIGVVAVVAQLYVWSRFIASGPVSLDRYREPGSSAYLWAKGFEFTLGALVVVTVFVVARSAIRQRTFTTNAMLLVAFASMLWLDPMLNYLRPGFYFSQNLVNVESWVQFLPGQLAPHANLTPVPVLWITGAYVGFFLPVIMANVAVLRWVRRKRPNAGLPTLMLTAFAVSAPTDVALEVLAIRTGVMAYPAADHSWSLWGGQLYQLPVIEILGAGLFWTICSVLVFLRDERGWTPVERGAERFSSPRVRTAMRQLALIGVANTLFLALPLGIVQISVAYTDDFPAGYPKHLRGDWCGEQGQPYGRCPGPGVPWVVRVPGQVDPSPAGIPPTG